jgi:hypothetical protein
MAEFADISHVATRLAGVVEDPRGVSDDGLTSQAMKGPEFTHRFGCLMMARELAAGRTFRVPH